MSSEAGMKDVIVADNDYIVRGILRSILEREGFTVLQAVDGLEAIDYAMRVNARLVILDYKMPRLDGFGACAQIRHLPGYADTPIAVLTAFDNKDTRAAASMPVSRRSWPSRSGRSIYCGPSRICWDQRQPTARRHPSRSCASGIACGNRPRCSASRPNCPRAAGC